MQFCLCQIPKPALVRYLVKLSIIVWVFLLNFNLTRKLSNVFKGFKVMPEYFKKQKFCEPQESREVSDIYFSIIYQSNSLAKKCGAGLIRGGKSAVVSPRTRTSYHWRDWSRPVLSITVSAMLARQWFVEFGAVCKVSNRNFRLAWPYNSLLA